MHRAPREEAELEGDAQHEVPRCGCSCWVSVGWKPLWVSQQLSQDDCVGKKCDIKSCEALPLESCGHEGSGFASEISSPPPSGAL